MPRSRAPSWALAALAALAVQALPRPCRADDAAEAQLHFAVGARSFRAHDYAAALGHFLQAYRLAPTANTTFNVAQTYLMLRREPEAFRFFSDFVARPDARPEPRAVAERALAALTPRVCRVEVRSDPPGASIYLDRPELGDLGSTPRVIAVEPGAHEVILRVAGRQEHRQRIEGALGLAVVVDAALRPVTGALRVTTSPAGASVELDGAAVPGVTPLALAPPIGRRRVRVRRRGYLDVVREVELTEAGTSFDERMPRDLTAAAVLSVVTTPPGAAVTLRGAALDRAPLTRDVDIGPALVRVEAPGRTAWQQSVLLRPGRALDLRVALGDPSARRPWWVPALTFGGAAVTVAGAVLGVAALAAHDDFDQSPERATLDRTHALNLAADVTVGVGAALLVSGVLAWVLTPDPSASRATVREEGLRASP